MKDKTSTIKKKATTEKKKQKTLIVILLISILVIALVILGYLYQDEIFGNLTKNEVAKKEIAKEPKKEKSSESLIKEKAKIVVEKKVKEKATKELAQKHKKYYLVGGVFKHNQNAEDFLTELEYDGFPASKFAEIKGLNYLCYNSFNDYSKAKTELQKIKNKGYEVWILKY